MISRRRLFGLVCAVSIAAFVVAWLTLSAPPRPSLAQDSPASTPVRQQQSPVETPAEQGQSVLETPTFTPTPTETDTPVPVEAPTDTPTDTPGPPEAPTETPPPPEPSTDTPTPLSSPAVDTATPEPTPTLQEAGPGPQASPTVEAEGSLVTETPTPRPVAFPTPTPSILVLMDRSLTGLLGAAAWIWFVCGSLVFFIVAGIVAGLGFYRRERNRYQLYDLTSDEETGTQPQAQAREDDDIWPPSLR